MSNVSINTTNISSDPSQIFLLSLINLLQSNITRYGMGLVWIIGNIGSVLTCIVFCQRTYHKSPCAMYFLAASICQLFNFNFALLTRMIHFGYNVDALNHLLWYCKIRFYLFYICVAVPRYNIILASIDRYFASSRNALHRQWSSTKIASRLIIGNVLFWSLIYIQILIFYEITNGTCSYRGGSYGIFFSIYIAIDSGIVPLLLMLIFGLLTVRNVHQTRKRIALATRTSANQVDRMSKKDLQLHRMLANQIALFILLNMANPIYLLYNSFGVTMPKSTLRRAIDAFAGNMTYLLIHLSFSLTFTNFMISSDIFRREFLQLIQTKILRRSPITTATSVRIHGSNAPSQRRR